MSTLSKPEPRCDKHPKTWRDRALEVCGVSTPLLALGVVAYANAPSHHPPSENTSWPAPSPVVPAEVMAQKQFVSNGDDGVYSGRLNVVLRNYTCRASQSLYPIYAVVNSNHLKLFYREDRIYEGDLHGSSPAGLVHLSEPDDFHVEGVGPAVLVRIENGEIQGSIEASDIAGPLCVWSFSLGRDNRGGGPISE